MTRTIFCFLLIVCCGGCNLFQTRDPQQPSQGSVGVTPPITPEIVLANLQLSIQNHNTDNYMRCFVDTTIPGAPVFTFVPSADFQGIFRNWQLEDERRYFQNLGAPTSGSPYLTTSNEEYINQASTTAEYTADYILFYPHHQAGVPTEVRGYMHLYLQTDGQHGWSIYRWEDTRTTTDSTWSYLKAHF